MCVTEPFLRTERVKSPGLLLEGRAKKLPSWNKATEALISAILGTEDISGTTETAQRMSLIRPGQ